MKIYVASSWRNLLQPGIVASLRSLGYEVYDFRNPGKEQTGFNWREIDPNWSNWNQYEWRKALNHPVARRGYESDYNALINCDAVVMVLPCGKSAHMEAAFMAAKGKPVLTLALDKTEPELMQLLLGPSHHICCDMNELFDMLERLK